MCPVELTPARAAWGLQVSSPDGKTTYKFESLTTSPYVPLTPSPTYVPHCRLSAFSNYPRIRVCNSLVLPCPPSLKCVDSPRTPLITIIRTELTSAVMLPLRRGTLRKRVHKCPIPSSPPPCSNHVCLGTAPQSLTHPATPLSGARDDSPRTQSERDAHHALSERQRDITHITVSSILLVRLCVSPSW